MNKPHILVTGGTGFLGSYTVKALKDSYDLSIISRSGHTEIEGDLRKWNAGIDFEKLGNKNFAAFIHLGGLYNLRATDIECFQSNIMGTQTAVKLAEDLNIPIFLNASSVAAAINVPSPRVSPTDLNFKKSFPDAYSMSKACVEQALINRLDDKIQTIINLRLGVLVGDTQGEKILRIDGPYHLPNIFRKLKPYIEKFPAPLPLPGSTQTKLPIVPVDCAARAIKEILDWTLSNSNSCKGYQSFHLTPSRPLSIEKYYRRALQYLNIKNNGVILVENSFSGLLNKFAENFLEFPEAELQYLLQFPLYDTTNTEKILGKNWCPEFSDYEKSFWSGYEKILADR